MIKAFLGSQGSHGSRRVPRVHGISPRERNGSIHRMTHMWNVLGILTAHHLKLNITWVEPNKLALCSQYRHTSAYTDDLNMQIQIYWKEHRVALIEVCASLMTTTLLHSQHYPNRNPTARMQPSTHPLKHEEFYDILRPLNPILNKTGTAGHVRRLQLPESKQQ